MGGCLSFSSVSNEEGYRPPRVWPSDEDGKWPYAGERDVDDKAGKYIDNFHQYQSASSDVPPTPAAG